MSLVMVPSQLKQLSSDSTACHDYSVVWEKDSLTISKIVQNVDVSIGFQFHEPTKRMDLNLKITDFNETYVDNTIYSVKAQHCTYYGKNTLINIQGSFNYLSDRVVMNKSIRENRITLLLALKLLGIAKQLTLDAVNTIDSVIKYEGFDSLIETIHGVSKDKDLSVSQHLSNVLVKWTLESCAPYVEYVSILLAVKEEVEFDINGEVIPKSRKLNIKVKAASHIKDDRQKLKLDLDLSYDVPILDYLQYIKTLGIVLANIETCMLSEYKGITDFTDIAETVSDFENIFGIKTNHIELNAIKNTN